MACSSKLKYLSRAFSASCRCSTWKVQSGGGRCYSKVSSASGTAAADADADAAEGLKVGEDVAPSSGICRPLSEILKELNKKVPDTFVKTRVESDGFAIRYIPW